MNTIKEIAENNLDSTQCMVTPRDIGQSISQTEEIVWHDYKKEKPSKDRVEDWFLLRHLGYETAEEALLLYIDSDNGYYCWMIHGEDSITPDEEKDIMGWAEMPKGCSDGAI